MIFKKLNYKLFIFLFSILFFCSVNIFTQSIEDLIKEKKQGKPSGPKIAIIPFDFTFEVGQKKAEIAANEIAANMIKNNKLQPFSLKEWIDNNYKKGKAANINSIVKKASRSKIPVDFICHGIIFKSGSKYGLKIALYPINTKRPSSYYFRSFSNFYSINNTANQIVQEIAERAGSFKTPLIKKNIYIKNFDVKFSLHTKSKSGDIQISNIPFIKLNNVEYKKEDKFINELLLYNFHISRIFEVSNNNIKKYTRKNPAVPSNTDYIISGNIDISKEIITLNINVTSNTGKKKNLFQKKYYLKNLETDNLYENTRKLSKDIIMTLLTNEEKKKIGEIELDAFYANNAIYCDNYYLGNKNQKSLILPKYASEIKTKFYKDWASKTRINISPSAITKIKQPYFKTSLGLTFISGLIFHPQFNNKMNVTFGDANDYEFSLGDIYNNEDMDYNFKNTAAGQFGLGIDLSFESKYFALTPSISVKFGEYYRVIDVKSANTLDVEGENINNFVSRYQINKFSVITDFSFLPSVLILPSDSPVRIYTGLGFFTSLWYNQFEEKLSGKGKINSIDYEINSEYEKIKSFFCVVGMFPEIGIIYKFLKFNFKLGAAYYFDLYKSNAYSNIKECIFDSFNTSSMVFKLSLGYYLN